MNEQYLTTGPVMKAARKFKKYNQADVAKAIGCSQSALSKMEHNLLIPSAPQWFTFSRFTDIPPESIEKGIIDRHTIARLNNDEISLGYKLPKRYRLNRAHKVRELYPIFCFIEKKLGTEIFTEFTKSTGLDSEFFLDFDNLVNFQLIIDSIHFLLKRGYGGPEAIKELVEVGQSKLYWDGEEIEWKRIGKPREVLIRYKQEQTYFQGDFKVDLEEQEDRIVLAYEPMPHLYYFLKELGPEIGIFLSEYRTQTIKNILQRCTGTDPKIIAHNDPQRNPLSDRFEIFIRGPASSS